MASRSIAIRITIDNQEAVNAAKAQAIAMKALNEETDKHTHLQNGLTNSFLKGNLAARGISIAYNLIKDSLKFAAVEAVQFEHNMTKIAVITETGKANLASLESTIRNLALATNQSQNEIAKAALEMGKMGFSGNQLEQALGGVVKLARALDEDLVRTGETVVQVLNAYGFSASDANKITDQLAFTVKASVLDIETFGTAFSYVGGTAKAAGVSFTELQGAMDVLSNAGIKASTIGTQLRRIIADLSDPSSKVGKVMGGQTIETLGLVGALEQLKTKNLDVAALTEIFGRTASSVSSILIRYAGVVGEMAKETEKATGVNEDMSKGMNTTLLSALQGIRTSWAELGIEISKSGGFLRDFALQAKLALDTLSERMNHKDLLKEFKETNPQAYYQTVVNNAKAGGSSWSNEAIVESSQEFALWKAKRFQVQADAKDKENSLAILQSTFDRSVKLPTSFNPDKQLDLIRVDPEQTLMFKHIERLWGTDKEGFQEVLRKAKQQFALKAEVSYAEEFDKKILETKKNKVVPEFDPMDVFDRLEDLQPNGDTYAESFIKKRDRKAERSEKKAVQKFAISKEEIETWGELNSELKKTQRLLETNATAFVGFKLALDGVNGSVDILSHYFVEGIFSEKKDPFKHISDAFGDFAKKMAADLVALTMKILFFKALIGGLNLLSPGAGAFGTALASAAVPGFKFASGTDQVVNHPTTFIAGEAGAERVRVTPRSKMGESSEGGVNITIAGDVYDYDRFERKVKRALDGHKRSFV